MTLRLLTRALQLAERGWFVFPLRPFDKRPIPGFTKWAERATTDPAQIKEWWTPAPYNIGIATGPSGLVVIDCDTPKSGAAAADWRLVGDDVEVRGHLLPKTFSVRTPSRGRHLYFSTSNSGLGNSVSKLGRHVDTRGIGGYVVGPGSVCRTGYYTVVTRSPVAKLPDWIREALTPQPATVSAPIPAHNRDPYVRAILDGEAERVQTATPGSRNSALNTAAFLLGQLVGSGTITDLEARQTLETAAKIHIGIHGFTESEMNRTIQRGLTAGIRRPRR